MDPNENASQEIITIPDQDPKQLYKPLRLGASQWGAIPDHGSQFAPDGTKYFSDYVDMLLKRKKLFLAVLFSAVIITGFALYMSPKSYRSSATLEIERPILNAQEVSDANFVNLNFNKFLATQIRLLKSRSLAAELVKKLDLIHDPYFVHEQHSRLSSHITSAKRHLQKLLHRNILAIDLEPSDELRSVQIVDYITGRMDVDPFSGTQLVHISMENGDPKLAKFLLDEYLDLYLSRNLEKMRMSTKLANDWLKDEISKVEKQLLKSQSALIGFTNKHGIVSLEGEGNHFISFFNKTADALVKVSESRAKLESFSNNTNKGIPISLSSKHLEKLQDELAAIEKEYYQYTGVYYPEHPKMKMLQTRMDFMRDKIAQTEREALKSALQAARNEEQLAKVAFESAKEDAMQINSLKIQHSILKKEVETNGQLFNNLLKRSRDLEVNLGTLVNNIAIREPPMLSYHSVKPKKGLWLAIGSFMGLVTGVFSVMYAAGKDKTLRRAQDVEKYLGLPYLGSIPSLRSLKAFKPFVYDYADRDLRSPYYPKSLLVQSLSNISASIMSLASSEGCANIAVSSALPSEGKTMLSTLIAIAMSSEGNSVLVIDADLRNPMIHKVLGNEETFTGDGLSDVLSDKNTNILDVIVDSKYPGLSYIPAGMVTSNPLMKLKSGKFKQALHDCKQLFDCVIVDAPPIIGLSDAHVLSGTVDGMILATKEGLAPVGLIRQAARMICIGKGTILGVVLTMSNGDPLRRD